MTIDTLHGKNILVTGATGLVGANLIKRLLDMGVYVRGTLHTCGPVISEQVSDNPSNINFGIPKLEYIHCDLTKMDDCIRAVADMDYVFMCAASTSGAATISATPLVHVTPNVIMNAQMLEAAYHAKVEKFIYLSSTTGYPYSVGRVSENEMFRGDPYDTYYGVGWMKRYTETLCKLYSEKLKRKMSTVVLRPTNIYGPYDKFDPSKSHVLAATIRKVVERDNPIVVWGSGNDVRDFIYVEDFIEAMLRAAVKVDTYDPINIGSGIGHTVNIVLATCLAMDGYADAAIVHDRSKPSMIPIRLVNTDKAQKMLGDFANTGIKEGIGKTIAWYRENRK